MVLITEVDDDSSINSAPSSPGGFRSVIDDDLYSLGKSTLESFQKSINEKSKLPEMYVGGLAHRPLQNLKDIDIDHVMITSSVRDAESLKDYLPPSDVELDDRLKGLPGNLKLSPAETRKYFGNRARHKFMERTSFIMNQRKITNASSTVVTEKLYYNNETNNVNDSHPFSPPTRKALKLRNITTASANSSVRSTALSSLTLSVRNNQIDNNEINNLDVNDEDITLDGSYNDPTEYFDFDDEENEDEMQLEKDNEDYEDDIENLTLTGKLINDGLDITEPVSPRTKYIEGCLREKLNPRASLVIRKKLTKKLELQHLGFGDDYGKLLAESLKDLPFLESINIADNNLTDDGLGPIICAIVKIPGLLEVDMSQNEIGSVAAEAMGTYLESESCTLKRLILKNADVDDFEGAAFITALMKNKSVKEIDLSNNKLGVAENLNTVMPDITTSGEALAELLRNPNCQVQTLKLAWNMLRLDGGIELASSLAYNKSLTYLDLSYNALGKDGGMALGDSLINNRTLKTLLLATNAIDSVACFTICTGVLENENLEHINLDGNAIGEQGARALMMIPTIVGARVKISAQKCNVSLRDSACYFDFDNLLNDYKLELSKPFERAIALLLLQLVVGHHTYIFENFEYEEVTDGKRSGRRDQIQLIPYRDTSKMQYFDDKQRKIEHGFKSIIDACSNIENAINFFNAVDLDGSGEVEKVEFQKLLSNMGIYLDAERLQECFDTYDTDQGGTLGITEFLLFLKKTHDETAARLRDLTSSPAYCVHNKPNIRYVPPNDGILYFSIVDGFKRKDIYRTLTSVDRDNIDLVANCTGDPTKMTSFGVSAAKLRLDEAFSLYNSLMADCTQNKTEILAIILPQLGNPADARMLVSKALDGNKTEMLQLRRKLGTAVRPVLGIVNGYFVLDLSKSLDRLCLVRLIEISKTRANVRTRTTKIPGGRVADLSHRGNNSCFRNEMFNGKKVTVNQQFATPMPKYGILSFDFSGSPKPKIEEIVSADSRVVKSLSECFLLKGKDHKNAMNKLYRYKQLSYMTNNGDAKTVYECDWDRATLIGDTEYEFYDNLSSRLYEHNSSTENEDVRINYFGCADLITEDKLIEICTGVMNFRIDNAVCPGSLNNSKNKGKLKLVKSIDDEESMNEENEQEDNNINANEDLAPTKRQDDFMIKLKHLLACENVKPQAKAARLLELLDDVFGKLWLYCRHVALICECFKNLGTIKKTDTFGTYRVELVISLFERIVDAHNFELIMRVLEPFEVGCLYCRLGWLSLYNPMKPEGSFNLDLSIWEERIVAKTIVVLATDEPGDNLSKASFAWDRYGDCIPGWEMTVSWCKEDGLPNRGTFCFTYYSGEGDQLNGCKPNIGLRKSLLQLVYLDERNIISDEERKRMATENEIIDDTIQTTGVTYMKNNSNLWMTYLTPERK